MLLLQVVTKKKYIQLANLRSVVAIKHNKSIIARHGIPLNVVTDNGPQFNSAEFKSFANEYEFNHIASSPNYPHSNGQIECKNSEKHPE